jgi:IS5 family transposase
VPKHDAFQRAFSRVTPQTLRLVNELLITAAVSMGLEDGGKLRVDTTVVQTDIHHPTDNTLLWDSVRVVTRLVGQLASVIARPIKGFCNRTRAARRRMQEIQRMTTTQRQAHQQEKYRELIGIADDVVESALARFTPQTRLPSWRSRNCAARSNTIVISATASSIKRVVACCWAASSQCLAFKK